jgi:hypothetical protein
VRAATPISAATNPQPEACTQFVTVTDRRDALVGARGSHAGQRPSGPPLLRLYLSPAVHSLGGVGRPRSITAEPRSTARLRCACDYVTRSPNHRTFEAGTCTATSPGRVTR